MQKFRSSKISLPNKCIHYCEDVLSSDGFIQLLPRTFVFYEPCIALSPKPELNEISLKDLSVATDNLASSKCDWTLKILILVSRTVLSGAKYTVL